jgi:hypothetical protein
MTDASLKAAREWLEEGQEVLVLGRYSLGKMAPALAALLDSWAERQHRASVTELRQAWTRGHFDSFDEAVRAVRDAPPPGATDD